MSLEDFDEALAQVMPSLDRADKRLRYKFTESLTKVDAVPLERLAQLSAYLMMYAAYSNRWISSLLISKEFLEMYFKDGIRDEESETSDQESDDDLQGFQAEINVITGELSDFYTPTTEQLEKEAQQLLASLE